MKKIGIALSGGGMHAVAHLGALKAFEEYGISPEIIAGTSMGSIIAGIYASGMKSEDIIEMFINTNKKILDVDYWGILKSISRFKLPTGFIKGDKIENLINKTTNNINIKDIDKKLAVVATNLNGGQMVIFSNGQIKNEEHRLIINDVVLSKAIRSSMCYPIAFKPVIMDDLMLVDGGIMENCPVNLCQEMGAEVIFVSSVAYNGAKLKNFNNTIQMISQIMSIALMAANEDAYDEVTVPLFRVPYFTLRDVHLLDISPENVTDLVNAGYHDTKQMLEALDLKSILC
jgi:NTE family protein